MRLAIKVIGGTRRTELALLAAVVVLTLVRVAATHHVFSAVVDEPVHIAAGYQWIVKHSNGFDPVHPPLARGPFARCLWRGSLRRGITG